MVGGDLRETEAGEVLVAEQVRVHLVGGGRYAGRVGGGLAVVLGEVERELLDRALGRLVHVQELGLDQLPVGDEPGVRLEAEEVLGRVDGDAPAVDLDAGQAAPARVERLGQFDRDGRGVDGGHRVSVSDRPGPGTGVPEPGMGVRNFGVPPGPGGHGSRSRRSGRLLISEPLVTLSGYGGGQLKRYTRFTAPGRRWSWRRRERPTPAFGIPSTRPDAPTRRSQETCVAWLPRTAKCSRPTNRPSRTW